MTLTIISSSFCSGPPMADMLHTPNLPNSSTFSRHSPLNLSPHPHSSFIRFAPLRRRQFSPSSVLAKLSDANSSQFDIVSRTELSDGSVSFKFGDASEISEIVEDFVGGNEVKLERECDESLACEDNVVADDVSDSTKAEEFEVNCVVLKESVDDNAESMVDFEADVQNDERNSELISMVEEESLSDLDAVKYEDQVVDDVVATCGSNVDVENEKAGEFNEVSEESDDDKLDHGGDELSNVGGMRLGDEALGAVVSLEDDIVKEEIVEDEIMESEIGKDEIIKDEIVKDEILEAEVVPLKDEIVKDEVVSVEDEIVEGIAKDEHVEDAVVSLEDEIVRDGKVEDEVVSLKDEIVEDGIIKDEHVQDEIVSLKDEIVNDEIVTDNIVKDEVVSLVDEFGKDETTKDEIVEDEVVSLKDKTVKDEIVEDEVVSLKDEIVEDEVASLKDKTVKDETVEDAFMSLKEGILKDEVVSLENEIVMDDIVSLEDETEKDESAEDENVKDKIAQVNIVKDESVEDENVKGGIVADEIEEDSVVLLEDKIEEDRVVSLEDETEEDRVVSLEDETEKSSRVFAISDPILVDDDDDSVELMSKKLEAEPILDEETNFDSLDDVVASGSSLGSNTVNGASPPIVSQSDDDQHCSGSSQASDPGPESTGVASAEVTLDSFVEKPTSVQISTVGNPMTPAAASSPNSLEVHDATIHTIAHYDDVPNMLVAAGPVKSGVTSSETGLNRLNKVEPSAPAFSISSAVATLAHSHEALTGRKDAYFVSGNWFGVADGVGQWSLGGVDIGLYAHELMQNCEKLLKSMCAGLINAKELLQQSAAMTQSTGSARVLIAQVADQVLHVANIGDSGFVIIRNGTVFQKSSPMVHEFSFPYAIGLGDDSVEDVEEYHIELEDGDMIVTATDGLFDNLYEQEIAFLVSKAVEAGMSLQDLAELLATKAEEVGRSGSARSPFADAAQAAGHPGYSGGKLDHVTVIVSLVQR